MAAFWYSIQWGFKHRLNKVKSSGGCHRFSKEMYRAELITVKSKTIGYICLNCFCVMLAIQGLRILKGRTGNLFWVFVLA
ncbi:MAG TPA: hypothetical protein DEO65_03615 [Bacillus bacterium]|nr:hypothetical protein [Bacillus sp. (in: firmicutes)]